MRHSATRSLLERDDVEIVGIYDVAKPTQIKAGVFFESYDDLLNTTKSCVMGLQASGTQFEGLCNAVICSKPQSKFLKIWLENYKTFDNSQWDNHSVHLPLELSKKHSDLIEIKSQKAFFPVSWWEFEDLFKKS